MNNYTVYKHIFPNNKIYIGITRQSLKRRWRKDGSGYKGQIVYNAIKKYGWENVKHKIIIDNLSFEEACNKEIEFIKKFKSNKKNFGYNVDNGGKCIESFSEETKQKIRKSRIGKKHSQETRNKISKSLTGQKRTEEQRKNISLGNKGKKTRLGVKLSEETKKKISDSHKEYYKRVNGNVWWKGKHHTEETKMKMRKSKKGKENIKKRKKIIQKDKNDNVIKEWDSIKQAAKTLNISNGNICSCLKGKLKHYKGYKWEYNKS